ncbi:hypothetical protein Q6A51_14220 [Pseudomonas sp. KFB-139]|uniref:Uncharacterized protein n=1 Tax=Pseudomonas serbiensis TaxID=3064350 RepID=A0ABT9CT98_9PSED|nr:MULTISPECIES: hypothetical protein [Pseudomonas]MDO7927947.1 hypothetical protein [Pseudomonas sp. KFB-138]
MAGDRYKVCHKYHEDVSPAARPVGRAMPVQLHQSALWAACIRGTSRRLAEPVQYIFSSAPDQGDSCIMQKEKAGVNKYVVIIFYHYIIF